MKLFKRTLTSRFAQSVRLYKERPPGTEEHYNIRGADVLRLVRRLNFKGDFHPHARAVPGL